MISILAAMVGLLAILWLCRARLPAVLATSLLMFSLAYRIIDVAYIDLAGPIYAIELERYIGGNGGAPYFVASVLCLVLPLGYFFRPKALLRGVSSPLPNLQYLEFIWRGGLAGVIFLLAILYGDMVRIGTIPLFVGMDRIEYNSIAGIFHNPAYSLGFLPAALLGILTVLPRLQGRSFSIFPVIVFLALLVYWALTGNRFSAFLLAICYFTMPFGAVIALTRAGLLAPMRGSDPWAAFLSARVIVPIIAVLSSIALIGLLMNSYYEVRGYSDPQFQIFQRILIQPVEIFASRWDLVLTGNLSGWNWDAINEVLLNPEDPNVNTTMRYFMVQELGYFRAMELLNYGTQYAGGYPEVFFELFGPGLGLLFALMAGIGTAALARFAVRNILKGRILSAMMTVYVMFALSLIYVSGMLNSLIAGTLAIKIAILVLVFAFERTIFNRGAMHRRSLQPFSYHPGARPMQPNQV